MRICIRCNRRRRRFVPRRRHCVQCQRLSSRLSYWRSQFKVLEYKARMRALSYGCYVEVVDYASIYACAVSSPGLLCRVCGLGLFSGSAPVSYLEFHHICDLSLGGSHVLSNIVLVHRSCNRRLSARQYLLSRLGS